MVSIKHTFVNAIPDDPTAAALGQTLPSHWNADHAIIGLPLASQRGLKVAIYGDSMTNQNNVYAAAGSVQINNENCGYMSWLNYLLGQPFYFPFASSAGSSTNFTSANFGVSGNTSTQALARISDVRAYKPDICIILIGTNDLTAAGGDGLDPSVSKSNINTILTTLTGDGILCVIMPILPRSTWQALTAPQIAVARPRQYDINQYIRNYPIATGNRNVIVSDPTPYIIDPASATGDPLAGMLRDDGLHPSSRGAYWMGYTLAQSMQYYEQFSYPRFMSQADVYNATNNIYGNLVPNGLLTGTAGTVGTGVTGTVADSWTIVRGGSSTLTAVASKGTTQVNGTAGTSQIINVSCNGLNGNPAAAEETIDMRLIANVTTGIQAGDIVQAGCDLAQSGMSGNWLGVFPRMEIVTGGLTYNVTDMDKYDQTGYHTNQDTVGRCVTPYFTMPGALTTLQFRLRASYWNTVAGGGTFNMSNIWFRKVG